MKKIIKTIVFLGMTYIYGSFSGVLFHLFRTLGIIKVLYYERFPRYQGNLILVSNHPSLLEPLLLPALFFPEYILYPRRLTPWSAPDKKNYWDKWFYFWMKPRAIPIDRGNRNGELKALFQMKEILRLGGRIILFPEGGRTFKGTNFLYSRMRKKLRELKNGIGWLVSRTEAVVVPVWIEGTENVLPNNKFPFLRVWRKITIKIGQPLEFPESPENNAKEKITQRITNALLKLADEEE